MASPTANNVPNKPIVVKMTPAIMGAGFRMAQKSKVSPGCSCSRIRWVHGVVNITKNICNVFLLSKSLSGQNVTKRRTVACPMFCTSDELV